MSNIRIETLEDDEECDTCGWLWARGARVYKDDELIVDLVPECSCFGGIHYDDESIFVEILKALGHTVEIVD